MYRVIFTILAILTLISPAEARKYRVNQQNTQNFMQIPWDPTGTSMKSFPTPLQAIRNYAERSVSSGRVVQMLAHPSGCPRRAFCGCGAATAVFGTPRRDLWQARAWFKFPRAQAASGNAGVRSHHVFILRQHVRGDVWVVEDYNSGRGQSRLHERSISGYTIVNPRA